MTGLCWFVQIAHYPLMKKIRKDDLPDYQVSNLILTGIVAISIMAIEYLSGFILFIQNPDELNQLKLLL